MPGTIALDDDAYRVTPLMRRARDPINPPLAAGEILSTGTLTKATPVAAGEPWSATPVGIALDTITLRLS
jgi:2-oxo-3-hexenedioate decarboxylase